MSELSIFIDESGDFGEAKATNEYYLVTFVFHNQTNNIKSNVDYLYNSIKNMGFNIDYIHTLPIIRREDVFANYSRDERRSLIYKMLNFTLKCPIKHATVKINRRDAETKLLLAGKISKEITKLLQDYEDYFAGYDKLIVYYDNGQRELSTILNAIFSVHFTSVEFRNASPQKYRLLQVADFICSIELLKIKRLENRLSKSEKMFFYKPNELKKTLKKR